MLHTTTDTENSIDRAAGKTVGITICGKILQFSFFVCTSQNQFAVTISLGISGDLFIDIRTYGDLNRVKIIIMQNTQEIFNSHFFNNI